LNEHRGIFKGGNRRPPRLCKQAQLNADQIMTWGNAYRRRRGVFPNRSEGPITGTNGLKWSTVDSALKRGSRGLPGGSSLAMLFGDRRKKGRTGRHKTAKLRRGSGRGG
jgi:hypothetical protein